MTERIVYLNGRYVPERDARISIFDSALQLGDMAYEVTRTVRHAPYRLPEHLARLRRTLTALRIDPQLSDAELERITLDVLARNLPSVTDTALVESARDLITASSVMTVRSEAGTDFTIDLVDSHPGYQKGFVDQPGKWDHWPSTMVVCWPMTSNGTIVLTAGDILLPFKEYVSSDIRLDVADGRIEGISGGPDAKRLQQFFDDSDDQWARSLSHMGWGLMKSANWFATAMYSKHEIMGMDARAFAGNFLWSTGPHPFLKHDSFAHLDIAMRGCTIVVDDTPVTKDGRLL